MTDDRDAIDRLGSVFFDSYFVIDRERRIQSHNEGFIQLLGLRPAQRRNVPQRPCYELLQLEICKGDCIALKALEKNANVRMEEISGKTPDGREIVVEASAIPLRDANGDVEGVFVTHRDV